MWCRCKYLSFICIIPDERVENVFNDKCPNNRYSEYILPSLETLKFLVIEYYMYDSLMV